uniref:Uncharacterized protein n=1 Tax=Rheinheimera sp. BAL341 TaxID=1708203 RepID=A0A486XNB6_9GAMM
MQCQQALSLQAKLSPPSYVYPCPLSLSDAPHFLERGFFFC